jgi:stearoyl-CoA desaturase (delta-9 desaturase)
MLQPEVNLHSYALGRTAQGKARNWATSLFLLLFHAGALAALFCFSWKNLTIAIVLYGLAINAGVGAGYHRLLTHRSFRCPLWLERALTLCGALALQGGPLFWVGTHREHHRRADREGDPHTPVEGLWWAHAGWISHGGGQGGEMALLRRLAPDLARDRFHCWLSRWHWLPLAVSGVALFAFGGWGGLLWGVFLRVTLGWHATWLVNSATHRWGGRRFATSDHSRNNWWVALLTGGEGWHNNHHAHPVSARHGLRWYEFDPNYYGIWLLEKLHLAWNVRRVRLEGSGPKTA